ncbi:branched-chain amino acid ABC transporter permease [Nocardioides marmotae]|uniref:Branched-chain amino acid ABC transporter permease n=1 Tax=Nocardioides marmotae TaxID=2663857 RepID=A0A6I3JF63_9ACTN|nr:branched-chain amino acid ABC transporter permease [Nocardioides marmotae]MCR6033109.1 branched-chain amino acid ABC transporter permease [Gordonia jinghuaiqii]MBC9732610.1 branched-chain amino acid ABC transporter permease [Nocardioides marmotae]MTB83728.1 branched-chain amino acid ABC transporter permease [Nocardioides marmotae]MTB96761.1 branched-chain amino acid ABC transporter permease [Nocardioides marmotae]QKE03030.1 branched-chain amino acid ABC transporter permease [Nocardioides ma
MTELLQTLLLGLLLGGVYALAASGLTLIFGVMRVINIAHGAFLILGAFVAYWLWDSFGIDPLLATLLTTPIVFVIGWLTYKVAVSPVRTAPMASTVLLTFGLALVVEGAMGEIWGNSSTAIRPSYGDESFRFAGLFLPKAQVYGGVIAVVVLVLLWIVLTKTWLGRAIRAAASNPASAELVGIKVASVAALVFALGIAAAGAGGAITGVLYPFVPGSHYQWIARLLAIVVLGGLGSLNGAVLGALMFGIAETMTAAYVSPAWATAVPYAIVFAVLLIRPQGLLGAKLREDAVAA